MRPLTDSCPKTLLPVRGRPFAYHQLHWLAAQGVNEVVYCIGHRGDLIRRYWAMEPSPVRSIRWVDEGERLRGTGGALRLACEQGVLEESFLVIYGDSFLPVRFAPVWQSFETRGLPALMTVLKNEGRWDKSNAIYQDGRVMLYDKNPAAGMNYIDYGLLAFHSGIFAEAPGDVFDLAALLNRLSIEGQLAGHEVNRAILRGRLRGRIAGTGPLPRGTRTSPAFVSARAHACRVHTPVNALDLVLPYRRCWRGRSPTCHLATRRRAPHCSGTRYYELTSKTDERGPLCVRSFWQVFALHRLHLATIVFRLAGNPPIIPSTAA